MNVKEIICKEERMDKEHFNDYELYCGSNLLEENFTLE